MTAVTCSKCGGEDSKVLHTYKDGKRGQITRMRRCDECGMARTTVEISAELFESLVQSDKLERIRGGNHEANIGFNADHAIAGRDGPGG